MATTRKCPRCSGKGGSYEPTSYCADGPSDSSEWKPCSNCHGTGKIDKMSPESIAIIKDRRQFILDRIANLKVQLNGLEIILRKQGEL